MGAGQGMVLTELATGARDTPGANDAGLVDRGRLGGLTSNLFRNAFLSYVLARFKTA